VTRCIPTNCQQSPAHPRTYSEFFPSLKFVNPPHNLFPTSTVLSIMPPSSTSHLIRPSSNAFPCLSLSLLNLELHSKNPCVKHTCNPLNSNLLTPHSRTATSKDSPSHPSPHSHRKKSTLLLSSSKPVYTKHTSLPCLVNLQIDTNADIRTAKLSSDKPLSPAQINSGRVGFKYKCTINSLTLAPSFPLRHAHAHLIPSPPRPWPYPANPIKQSKSQAKQSNPRHNNDPTR
jgi:hypothetical protein